MIDAVDCKSDYDKRSIRDNLAVVGWVFVWMASLVVSDKAALYGWWTAEWITWLSIAINLALGIWMVMRFMRMLRGMDDLQRKIQFDALGMSLGISMVSAITYSLLVTWGYIQHEQVSDLFAIMCVSYAVTSLIGTLRYR